MWLFNKKYLDLLLNVIHMVLLHKRMRFFYFYLEISCLPATDSKSDVISLSGPGDKLQACLAMIIFDGIVDGFHTLLS